MPRATLVLSLCIPLAFVAGAQAGVLLDTLYLRPDVVIYRVQHAQAPRPAMWLECSEQMRNEINSICKNRRKRL